MNRLRDAATRAPGRALVVVLALLVVVGGGAWLAWPRGENPSGATTAPAPPSIPILVSAGLAGGVDGAAIPAGSVIPVTGHALAASAIRSLELWDGGTRWAVSQATTGSPAFHARWDWRAGTPGEHVLFVRAVDTAGRVAQSAVVRVTVNEAASAGRPHADLAAAPAEPAYGISLPAVQLAVSGCTATLDVAPTATDVTGLQVLGLPPGAGMFVPIGTFAPNPGGTSFVAPLPPGTTLFTVAAFNASQEAYAAPVSAQAVGSCVPDGWSGDLRLADGHLLPAPSADRAYLYLRRPGQNAVRIPADPSASVMPGEDGSFDFSGLLPAVGSSAYDIEAWGWANGALTELGTGHFQPPPATPTPQGGTAGGEQAASQTWYVNPSAGLAGVTQLHIVHQVVVTAADPNCSSELCLADELITSDSLAWPDPATKQKAEKTFRWETLLPPVTKVVVQVLPYAPASTPNLAPPFLIDQKTLTFATPVSSGDFTLDLRPYLLPEEQPLAAGDQQLLNQQLAPIWGGGQAASSPTPTPAGAQNAFNALVGGNATVGGGGTSSGGVNLATVGDGLIPIGFAGRFYIRIIPIEGGTPGQPSGPVTIDMVDAPPPLALAPSSGPGTNEGAYDISFSVTLPKAPNPTYARCAIVKAITANYVPNLVVDYKAYLASGKPLCYSPPDDSGWSIGDVFEAFVEFVEDVSSWVSESYDWVKEQVVQVILTAVPCKAIASDAVCETIAKTALDSALASFGIPPSLPNFDQVVAAAKGDLASFVVQAAGVIPGVAEACGLADAANVVTSKVQSCTDLAGEAVDEVVAQVAEARSNAAGKASGYGWPGVVLEPDPRGEWQPPSVTYTVTRTGDPVLPSACTTTASLQSTVHDWHWPELVEGYPVTATGDVTGPPFLAASAPIPQLQPGETFSRQVWLTQPSHWTESQDAWEYWYYYEGLGDPLINRTWVLLQKGAELTFQVAGNCTPTVKQTFTLTEAAYDL